MLGRRKAANSKKFVNLTERIRQRALSRRPGITRQAANDDARYPRRDDAAEARPKTRARSATILSFDDTPVYRIAESGAIKTALLHQVLPVLEDRLDCFHALDDSRETLGAAVHELIDETLADLGLRLDRDERSALIARLLDELAGLGPLEMLLSDDSVSEIMVNGRDQVFVERRGRRQLADVAFRGDDHLLRIARRIALNAGRRLDEACPMADVRLADGHRASVIVPPLARDGVSITIRKREIIPLHRMARQGTLSRDMSVLLALAVATRRNILISGAGGSGRTTLLNALLEIVDPNQRVVSIEAFAELRLPGQHAVRLEARPASPGARGEVTQRDLLRSALGMRPDRIVLGEAGNDEALDLVQALTFGHRGSMATIRAKSPEDALRRLETMMGAADGAGDPRDRRCQIARAVDLVVQIERMRDGGRRVTKITEVLGLDADNIRTQDLFIFERSGEDGTGRISGTFQETGARPAFTERLGRHQFGAPLDRTF